MKGKVKQIIGPVVDIEFDGHVPAIYNAIEVKVGDKVLYGKYSGTEVTVDGDEFLIMRESDIFAIM